MSECGLNARERVLDGGDGPDRVGSIKTYLRPYSKMENYSRIWSPGVT